MRRPLSTKARLQLFLMRDGECHLCRLKITPGQEWQVEHVVPLAMGGEDGGENLHLAHTKCHAKKTSQDVADIARAKRRQARHLGVKKPRTIKSWRKFNGEIVRRD